METLKTSETLVEGLVADGTGNPVSKSFDFGKEKRREAVSEAVAESGGNVKSVVENTPMKGISLFVDLKGGITTASSHHHHHHHHHMEEEHVFLGNKLDAERMSNVKGGLGGEVEWRANVGDFVWALINNQSWWPGIACDGAKNVQEGDSGLLIRCFGDGSYIRCPPYQLKPFVGYFEQLSKQSNSKGFVDALEKAVSDFGVRIKAEFTCPCLSKPVVERRGDIGSLSVSWLDPATLLDYIKDLARDISLPSKIDYAINQNFLSAFHLSSGHCQIPLDQLKPAKIKIKEENGVIDEDSDEDKKDIDFIVGNGIKNRSEKHYETRERRKSRFLSYPYTNLNAGSKGSPVTGERGIEGSRAEIKVEEDLNKTNDQPVKKPRKKWCRKSVTKHELPGEGVQANVCSSEVLFDLQCAAQDCLFPRESKKFDSVERFIAGFRKWTFNDFTSEITSEQVAGQKFGIEMKAHQILPEVGEVKPLSKRGRKKKNLSVSSPMSGSNLNRGSLIIDFQNVGSLAPEPQSMAKKTMEAVADQGLQRNEMTDTDPASDMNGQSAIFNLRDLPVTGRPPCKLVPKRRKTNVASDTCMDVCNSNVNVGAVPNVNGHMNPFLFNAIPQRNDVKGIDLPTAFQFHPMNEAGSAPPFITGSHGANVGPKKRGRKRKNMDLQANAGFTMMLDANENCVSDPACVRKNMDLQANAGSTMMLDSNENGGSAPACVTGSHGEAQAGNHVFQFHLMNEAGSAPPIVTGTHGANLGPKKRGRKRKTTDLQPNAGSTIMLDSNENGVSAPACVSRNMDLQANAGSTVMLDSNENGGSAPACVTGSHGEAQAGNHAFQFHFMNEAGSAPPFVTGSHGVAQAGSHAFQFQFQFHPMNEVGSAPPFGIESHGANLGPKKRERKRKNMDLQANAGSTMMLDTNENGGSAPACVTGSHGEAQAGSILAGVDHEPKKRGRKSKNMDVQANAGSPVMPDSKENGGEKKRGRRGKRSKETGVPCIDLSYSKVVQDNEVTGTAFLLKFSSEHPLPSKEDLNSVFCKYGALNESESQVLNDSLSGQVVFLDSSSAGEAFWGLQNDQPFGEALVNYRIQHLPGAESVVGFKTPIKGPPELKPLQLAESTDSQAILGENEVLRPFGFGQRLVSCRVQHLSGGKSEVKQGEAPDLASMKKQLEMMTSMLKAAGHTVSPEMRVQLEGEIKGLMKKMGSMDGSTSSCL